MLQQLDQSDNQTALGNQGTKQPFQQIDLKGFNLPLDSRYIGLGGQIVVEQIDLLGRQNLGLFLGKAVRRQAFEVSEYLFGLGCLFYCLEILLAQRRFAAILREPCAPADTEPRFFLHIVPANANDLPSDRKRYGFNNLDFSWRDGRRSGRHFDGKCPGDQAAPGLQDRQYPDGPVHTGEGQIWAGTLTLNR